MSARKGSSLLEVQVALPLIALLGVVAVSVLLQMYRVAITNDSRLSAIRELRQGATVLASELRPLRARDIITWSDTMIELHGVIGIGIVCNINAARDRVSVTDASAQIAAQPDNAVRDDLWRQPPQVGDRAELWTDGDALDDSARTTTRTIAATGSAPSCPLAPPSATRTTSALTLDRLIRERVLIGAPLRVTRQTRFSLYRAGDGYWYLGRRTLSSGVWDVIQPVVGPLLAPRDRGLVISAFDSAGTLRSPSDTRAELRMLRVRMRAPHTAGRIIAPAPRIDSLVVDIALRGVERDGESAQ